jgi:hypothetical protein
MMIKRGLLICLFLLPFAVTGAEVSGVVAKVVDETIMLEDLRAPSDVLEKLSKLDQETRKGVYLDYQLGKFTSRVIEIIISDYAQVHNIEISADLVNQFKQKFTPLYQQDHEGSDKEASSIDDIANKQVLQWLVERALYQQYGGVVVFQQGNPLYPIEAYYKLILDYQAQGKLSIEKSEIQEVFLRGFAPPYKNIVNQQGINFQQPWWLK